MRCRPGVSQDELTAYPEAFETSWLHNELYRARNFKQWMSKGLYLGTLMVGWSRRCWAAMCRGRCITSIRTTRC